MASGALAILLLALPGTPAQGQHAEEPDAEPGGARDAQGGAPSGPGAATLRPPRGAEGDPRGGVGPAAEDEDSAIYSAARDGDVLGTDAPTQDDEEEPPVRFGFAETGEGDRGVPRAVTDTQALITDARRDTIELRSDEISLQMGMLLSAWADFGFAAPQSDDNGFVLTDARVAFVGELGELWDYALQVDFIREPSLLDFRLTFQPHPMFRLQLGRFKVPFSGEFMVPAADVDLNRRSLASNALRAGRSVGVELGGSLEGREFFYRAGVFNGTLDLTNDDANFLLVVRAGTELALLRDDVTLTVAANATYSDDAEVALPLFDAPFSGERLVGGGDARLTLGPVFVSSELLWGRFEPGQMLAGFEVWGYHATVGWRIVSFFQVLLRWEALHRHDRDTETRRLVGSLAFVVPDFPPLQFQADVWVPVDEPEQLFALASATVAF